VNRNMELYGGAKKPIPFPELLDQAQKYMSASYPKLMSEENSAQKREKMLSCLRKFISDRSYAVDGMDDGDAALRLYEEMAEFSFLTPYFNYVKPGIEGIEINSYKDILIKHVGGWKEKSKEHFRTPQDAKDIFNRLLRNAGYKPMDDGNPLARGNLGSKIRITVNSGGGTLDDDVGVCASIRFINPSGLTKQDIIRNGTMNAEMFDLLSMCYRYGRSMLLAGPTNAGKTTLMSIIMEDAVPDEKKLITIEYGDREFNLVKLNDDGTVKNNVVHMRTTDTITPQMLLEFSMTMNPEFLCMAEIRGSEAFETMEAALTGHPVIGTVHVDCCKDIPDRVVQLASMKCGNLSDTTLYRMFSKAFPILFYEQLMEDNVRRVTEIYECCMDGTKLAFQPLWLYDVACNEVKNGKTIIHGQFNKKGTISKELQYRLRTNGIPDSLLKKIVGGGAA